MKTGGGAGRKNLRFLLITRALTEAVITRAVHIIIIRDKEQNFSHSA